MTSIRISDPMTTEPIKFSMAPMPKDMRKCFLLQMKKIINGLLLITDAFQITKISNRLNSRVYHLVDLCFYILWPLFLRNLTFNSPSFDLYFSILWPLYLCPSTCSCMHHWTQFRLCWIKFLMGGIESVIQSNINICQPNLFTSLCQYCQRNPQFVCKRDSNDIQTAQEYLRTRREGQSISES